MGELRSILEGKDGAIHAVGPEATAYHAVERMWRAHVGVLLVFAGDVLVGSTTLVGAVMSKELACIGLDEEPAGAMAMMTAQRCRHLPVLKDGRVVGIVSMGDLVHWVTSHQEYEIRTLTEYVSGVYAHAG